MKIRKPLDLNPVAIKELRQVVRSRMVSTGLIGLLFVQVAAVVMAIIIGREGSSALYGNAIGKAVAVTVMVILGLVVYISIPIFISTRMMAEFRQDSMDLQFTTSLTPTQFIDGKMLAAVAMMLLFASTSLPFLMLAYLLRGMDIFATLAAFAGMGVGAVVLYYFALLFATLKLSRVLRVIVSLIMVQTLFSMLSLIGEMFFDFSGSGGMSVFSDEWLGIALALLGVATACLLMRSLAAFNISHPNSNSARPFRSLVVVLWAIWLLVSFGIALYESDTTAMLPWCLLSVIAADFLMFIAVSSRPGCSRRVLSEISSVRTKRVLQFPIFTGAENAIVFALALGAVSLAIGYLVDINGGTMGYSRKFMILTTAQLFMYPCAFFLTARIIWELGLRKVMGNRYVGLLGLILIFVATLLPTLIFLPESLDVSGPALKAPGNLVAVTWAASTTSEPDLIYHMIVSAAWLTTAFLLYMPILIKAFKAFHPPAKRQPLPEDMPASAADTAD